MIHAGKVLSAAMIKALVKIGISEIVVGPSDVRVAYVARGTARALFRRGLARYPGQGLDLCCLTKRGEYVFHLLQKLN